MRVSSVRTLAGLCVGVALAVGGVSAPVQAQEVLDQIPGFRAPEFVFDENSWYLSVGVGVLVQPKFSGSDQYTGVPFPVFSLAKGGELYDFNSVDDSSSITLLDFNGFSGGAAWGFNLGRNEDSGEQLAGLGEVSPSFEAGGFLQWFPVSWFRLRGEFLYGMGGFNGWVGNAGADFIAANGPWRFALGPRVNFAGSDYMETFFGITPTQSAIAGFFGNPLPAYQPNSGVESWGVTAQVTKYLGKGFTWGMYGNYSRLVGDAADSPLTQSANQFEAGMSISYAINLGKSWW